jgi:hypothetical protein
MDLRIVDVDQHYYEPLDFDAQMTSRPDAACATATAFNRWIEEDWGFAYRDRIFAAAFISPAASTPSSPGSPSPTCAASFVGTQRIC